jgi:hypothetical protein
LSVGKRSDLREGSHFMAEALMDSSRSESESVRLYLSTSHNSSVPTTLENLISDLFDGRFTPLRQVLRLPWNFDEIDTGIDHQ